MIMYKVRDRKTGLYRKRKDLWPRWDEEGTLFMTKAAAKCSVSYSTVQYEIIGYEVVLKEVSTELYKGQK